MRAVRRGWPSKLGAWARCALVLATLATLASVELPSAAQSFAAQGATRELSSSLGSLPPGLASVWRVNGRKVGDRASSWSLAAFSTDGKLVGVADDGGTRVYRASDGRLLRMFPAPFSTGQFAFSLAISSTGLVAMGRVGGLDVHQLDR